MRGNGVLDLSQKEFLKSEHFFFKKAPQGTQNARRRGFDPWTFRHLYRRDETSFRSLFVLGRQRLRAAERGQHQARRST